MIAAARKAARTLQRDFGEVENLQVSVKGPGDFVSAADIRAENIIREELEKARPGYGFLMEESGEVAGSDKTHRWIVDPLDGTTNFLHGIPMFAISIALERTTPIGNQIVAGVVYNPITDEMFVAEKGNGAFLNSRRLRVSARRDISQAVVATGIPHMGRPGQATFLRELATVMDEVAGVRRSGSAALDMAYVAAGRFDAYWETGIKPWDIAAGVVLVREAGGFVSDIDGGDNFFAKGSVIATNDPLQKPMGTLLKKAHSITE